MAHKVYDDEQTDSDRLPHKVAANDQQKAADRDQVRDLEEHFNKPSVSDDVRQANVKKQEESAGKNDEADQKQQESFLKKARDKFKGLSNRKKAAMGLGVGGVGGLLVFASLITSTYRIPSLMGSIDNDQNSSRIVRLIVERRFERMLVEYQIRSTNGTIRDYVKEGSLMDKLYKSFDAINLKKIIEQEQGITTKMVNGHVHFFHYGKDVGQADNWTQHKALKKKDKQFAKGSKRVVTHTVPIARFSFSSTLRRWIINKYGVRFRPPKWDKTLTREQNLEKMRLWQISQTSDGTISLLRQALVCALESECDYWKDDNKPVDTATESPKSFDSGADPQDRDAKVVAEETDKAATTAKEKVAKTGASFYEAFVEELTKNFAKILTSRLAVDLIPIVGQINLMAELDHVAWVLNESQLKQKMPVFLKEQAYASMSAVWRAFADNMKLGDLDIEQVNVLNASVIGVEGAATYNYLFKGVATVGEAVDPRVDSNVTDPMATAQDFIYRKTGRRISHEIFNIWYQIISRPLDALADAGFGLIFNLLGAIGLDSLFSNAMNAMFGENWQEKLAKWSANAVMELFGIAIDPLATGAKLFNYLYVGGDVIMNKYCQTNLGCQAVSDTTSSGIGLGMNQMLKEDRDLYMSSLSLQERLFSLEESGSLINAAIREMPDTMSPGSTFSAIVAQVTQLPTKLLSVITHTAFAEETPNQDAAIAGQKQFGASDAQLDEDIDIKVREDADPQCPDNDDAKFNKCQADKEVNSIAMCYSTDCPQFIDSANAPVDAAPGSGPVSTTGDIKALAKQLLDLRASGQIKMNPEVVQDLTNTMNGNPIGTCGVQNLDAALLNLLLRIASKYKFTIWNIVTGHGCNFGTNHFHPKGQATDIGAVNGEAANLGQGFRPLMNATLAREFALFVAGSMPTGRGGMGQSDCTVLVPVNNWPQGVQMFTGDGCNHFHVDVGEYK